MIATQKTLWEEGMFLTPQHFQQWDRYHEALLRQRLKSIRPLDWGITALALDEDALLNGMLTLTSCAGTMRNGTYFDAPDRDPLPASRNFLEFFDPQAKVLGIYVGVPILRSGGLVCRSTSDGDGGVPTPGARRTVIVDDDTRVGSEREIATVVHNLRVLFDGESFDDFESIKVAEIGKTPTGQYALNPDYVPPCQYASVSPFVMRLLRRATEILVSKSEELAGQQRKTGGMAEAARFWLLHTANSHLPRVLHYYYQERVHPETIFLELSQLAAELCTFTGSEHPRDLPVYVHDDLGTTFSQLAGKLRFLLDTVIPTKCVEVALEAKGEALFTGRLEDPALLEQAQFYLSVGADAPEEALLAGMASKARVSSRDKMEDLIASALRGLRFKHVPSPPAEIPVEPGHVYFQIEKFGPHWDAIAASHTIAIHCPLDFAHFRLELLAVKG